MSGVNPDLPHAAISALEKGHKIEAIKLVRVAQGVGLKEAKDIVEEFIERSPGIKNRMASANAESARNGLGWLFLLVAIAAVAYYFYIGVH